MTLAGSTQDEGANAKFVFTATLSNASQGVTTITTDKGVITIQDGQTTGTLVLAANNGSDVYLDKSSLTATVTGVIGGNFEAVDFSTATATAKVEDTIDTTTVSITALVTKTSVITVDNVSSSGSFKVTATGTNGSDGTLSKVTKSDHDGFGVTGTTSGSGNTAELGYGTNGKSEKITVEFNNEVKTFDVQFAWRNNSEQARVDFYDAKGNLVGHAIVSGGGSDTQALVTYYDANGNKTKTERAAGGSDKVDLAYTFEPGSGVTFTKAVFSAVGTDDDYLIHSIKYKEVVAGGTENISGSTDVVFDIQTSNPPDASKYDFIDKFPIATVVIGGKTYEVALDKNGHGTVAVTTDGSTDLTATVIKVEGNFESVAVPSSLTLYTAVDAVDDNIITNILSSSITVDAAVLKANDHLGQSPQALADKTIGTGWKGLTGADFKSTKLKTVDFDGTDKDTIGNREASINREDFLNNLTASTASIQVDGYLAKSSGSSQNDEDRITVSLKAGEKLSYSVDSTGIEVEYIYNGVPYSITNKTFEAAADGQYVIHLTNTTNSVKNYMLTLKVDYSDAVANDSYTLKDADGSDTANISLTYQSGNTLTGTDANNTLLAGSGNDSLNGGKGNDVLVGGKGHDTLIGGDGDDIFLWVQGDQGTTATPAYDVIKDFGRGETGKGTDTLDLSDLLQGENSGNLSSYLSASQETVNGKASTVLTISSSGHLGADGVTGADQKIVLEGVVGDDGAAKLVQELIAQGKLLVNQ